LATLIAPPACSILENAAMGIGDERCFFPPKKVAMMIIIIIPPTFHRAARLVSPQANSPKSEKNKDGGGGPLFGLHGGGGCGGSRPPALKAQHASLIDYECPDKFKRDLRLAHLRLAHKVARVVVMVLDLNVLNCCGLSLALCGTKTEC
jgi:hypothetical protein